MALSSLPKPTSRGPEAQESRLGLWLPGGNMLSVSIRADDPEFPPDAGAIPRLDEMVMDLARAMKSVAYAAENRKSADFQFEAQPMESLADAIILVTQIRKAISDATGKAIGRVRPGS